MVALLHSNATAITCEDANVYYENECPKRSTQSHRLLFRNCCEASIPVYECEKNVHDSILADYDTSIPPIVREDTPFDIGVSLVYMFLKSIEEERGAASVVFNVTFIWNDPRLKWDVIDNSTCADFINVYTGTDIETDIIWAPSFNLLNRISGFESYSGGKQRLILKEMSS